MRRFARPLYQGIQITLLLTTAGCGSVGDEVGFRSSYVAAQCAFFSRCGLIAASDLPACITQAGESDRVSLHGYSRVEAISGLRLGFDVKQAQACLDGLAALGCQNPDLTSVLACSQVYRPLVAAAAACNANNECMSGICLENGPFPCAGICRGAAATGSSCQTNPCGSGDYCDASMTCSPRVGLMGACTADNACVTGLTCISGTCNTVNGATIGLGQPCSSVNGSYCEKGLYCNYAKSPAACAQRSGQGSKCMAISACNDGLTCIGPASGGVCKPFIDAGFSCDPTLPTTGCPTYAPCDGDTKKCKSRFPTPGTACMADSDCGTPLLLASMVCSAVTRTCVSLKVPGEACDVAITNQCDRSSCDQATRLCATMCH